MFDTHMLDTHSVTSDLSNTLSKIFSEDIQIVDQEVINHKQHQPVFRVRLDNNSLNINSLIVKYINSNPNNISQNIKLPSEFVEEDFNYSFLEQIRDSFALYPKLIARSHGLIILEDLGENNDTYPDEESMSNSIATTLAKLHAVTFNQYPLFQKLRKAAQLDDSDRRFYNQDYANFCFDVGTQQVKDYCNIFNIKTSIIDENIEEIKKQIMNPGIFLAFIHDDLASLRQSVSKEQEFYLLDFEQGKYAHALLDISKMLVGQIEFKHSQQAYFINFLNFPLEFTDLYREKYEQFRQQKFNNELWQRSLSSSLIYNTLIVAGELFNLPPELKPMKSIPENLSILFSRLLILLERNDSHQELKSIFQQLNNLFYF